MTNYRSAEVRPSAEGSTVVMHCSDPRFQPHFQDFCRTALGIDHYALIAVPGGPQLLDLPESGAIGWPWAQFMVELTHTPRIVLIVHDDCRWYMHTVPGQDPARLVQRMLQDARRVRATLLERFGPRTIEIYYAHLEGTRAHFQRVAADPEASELDRRA